MGPGLEVRTEVMACGCIGHDNYIPEPHEDDHVISASGFMAEC